jgi:hypothetical protein
MLHPELTEEPMTDDRMALVELLQKSGDGDFLRSVAEAVLPILMEAEPPRDFRRLQLLRGWSHDEASSPIFP